MAKSATSYGMFVAVIIGLIIGVGGTKIADRNKTTAKSAVPTASTKAADLRANLVNLGVQHMDLTDQAIDAALDGSPNAAAAKADLISNGEQISAAVGSIYGTAAQNSFQTLWNNHLTDFVNYAVATKSGNLAAQTAALSDIQVNYTTPISKLLAAANPNLPESALESEFGDHVTMTAQMITDHVKGDYSAEAMMRAQGDQHLEGIMSTLAAAIVKQYPAKF